MGRVLKFGRNSKNYKLPVGKPKAGVKSSSADAIKALRAAFTDAQVREIKRELEAEADDEG